LAGFQCKRSTEGLIEIGGTAHRMLALMGSGLPPGEFAQPGFQELNVRWRDRQLQRIDPRGYPVLQQQIVPAKRAQDDLQAAILVEYDLGRTLAAKHGNEKTDENGLPRPGRSA